MSSEPHPLHNRRATDPKRAALADALSYESSLPLAWTAIEALPDVATLDRYAEDNLRVLAAVALLDEARGSPGATEDSNGMEGEIARMNQKLNLLVDLVTFLVNTHAPSPASHRLRLSWQGLAWSGTVEPGLALISLRLHRSVPQPFVWPARIVAAGPGEVEAVFEPFGDACQTALERHVFMRHRRSIAGHRRVNG